MKSRARLVFALVAVAAASAAGVACVLADPPPLVQLPPLAAPHILTDSVSPPLDRKILAPTDNGQTLSFAVPVEVDPDQTIQWRVYMDVDPNLGLPGFIAGGTDDGGTLVGSAVQEGGVVGTVPAEAGVAVRVITFDLKASAGIDFDVCHTFKFVVAYDFDPSTGTPVDPPGGDSATWFYEPLPSCSYDDAAPPFDAATLDGASD
jgi:hypothetical protein